MKQTTTRILLTGILLLALFGRLWQITTMPGGLFPDQAANGEDAISILHGNFQPFYERGNGREALFFYLQATLIGIFGIGVWPMFLASALVGIFTVWATYAAGRRMFGNSAGILAGFFIAINQWHISLSRTGFRAIMVPLFIALTAYFFTGIFQKKTNSARIIQGIGAGISFGLGWYTYIAFRASVGVFIVVAVAFILQSILRKPRFLGFQKFAGPIVIAFLTSILVVAPLGLYFWQHPGTFAGRTGQVSILNKDLNKGHVIITATNMLEKSILAFFTSGDINPRHNVPGFPFLSPIPAIFLVIGFVLAFWRTLQYIHRLLRGKNTGNTLAFFALIILAMVMIVPASATAEGIPHGLRSIGEIPVVFWLAGIGGAWVIAQLKRIQSLGGRRMALGVLIALFLATGVYELFLYFRVSASMPKYWYEYRSDLTTVSNYIMRRAELGQSKPYLALDDFSVQTVHFLTTQKNYPYILIRPEEAEKTNLKQGEVIIFTQSTLPDAERYKNNHPEADEISRTKNQFGETTMLILGT
jgi:4-amino-4-deoxy-L-arabinose transferase-like glycosyltransferase